MEKIICKGKKITRQMKSRASAIFPKSVVMRLLIRPTELPALDVSTGGSPVTVSLASPCFFLDCLEEVELIPDELDPAVSSEDDNASGLTAVSFSVCSDTSACGSAVTVSVLSLVPPVTEVA